MAEDESDDTEALARLARAELRRRGKSDEEIDKVASGAADRPEQAPRDA
jgi:hypothetical protein